MDYVSITKHIMTKDEYPALIFIFSRKRVEEHATHVASLVDLLGDEAKAHIQWTIHSYNENASQRLPERLETCLMSGIGYHHAGLLPGEKSLVEDLFGSGYLPIVFCSETFAMGVNYPARSVVIGQFVKRDNAGSRLLMDRELLQMGGRAGRRGQDDCGTVYLCVDSERPGQAPTSVPVVSEPVKMSPEYPPERVLRVIHGLNGDRDQIKKYVMKSLAAFVQESERAKVYEQNLEGPLKRLVAKGRLQWQPNELFENLRSYRQIVEKEALIASYASNVRDLDRQEKLAYWAKRRKRIAKSMKKQREKIRELESEVREITRDVGEHRIGMCVQLHGVFRKDVNHILAEMKEYEKIPDPASQTWSQFSDVAGRLSLLGFLEPDLTLTEKGLFALDIGYGGVALAEVISRMAEHQHPHTHDQLLRIVGGCLCDEGHRSTLGRKAPEAYQLAVEACEHLNTYGMQTYFSYEYGDALVRWAETHSIEETVEDAYMMPGDFVILARRAAEVLRNMASTHLNRELSSIARDLVSIVWRNEVAQVF